MSNKWSAPLFLASFQKARDMAAQAREIRTAMKLKLKEAGPFTANGTRWEIRRIKVREYTVSAHTRTILSHRKLKGAPAKMTGDTPA